VSEYRDRAVGRLVAAVLRRIQARRLTGRFMAVVVLVVAVAAAAFAVADAGSTSASEPHSGTYQGKTSQHGFVRVGMSKHGKLQWLIIELTGRCSDKRNLTFGPGFQAPFHDPQNASGRVSDSYDIVGRNFGTAVRFRQRAKFSARLKGTHMTGTAQATQTLLAHGVVCKSPRVRFRVHV
jgi:hypothetical protein